MKIYTKTGDTGETSLFGGARVPKDDLRIRTYGTLDELNASLGVVLSNPASSIPQVTHQRLLRIQSELFQLGAELATPRGKNTGIHLIEVLEIGALETEIDEMEAELKPLKSFILPGGSLASTQVHLARTISRRAEREMITLHRAEPLRATTLEYLNRLSDYLFVSARYINLKAGIEDISWNAPKLKRRT